MDRRTDGQMDGMTDRRMDGRTDGQTYKDESLNGWTDGRTDERTNGRTDRRTDGQTDTWPAGQPERGCTHASRQTLLLPRPRVADDLLVIAGRRPVHDDECQRQGHDPVSAGVRLRGDVRVCAAATTATVRRERDGGRELNRIQPDSTGFKNYFFSFYNHMPCKPGYQPSIYKFFQYRKNRKKEIVIRIKPSSTGIK